MKETEIAKPLIRWLSAQRWDVYQEVQIYAYSNIADIVAVRDGIVWVLELKNSLTAALIEQASRWLFYSHYTSVVTPCFQRFSKGRSVLQEYMGWKGIGHIESESVVNYRGKHEDRVREQAAPRLHRKAQVRRLREALCDDHKTFAEAGNSNGKRWSPFHTTAKNVRRLVADNPGCTLKFLVEHVEHHYATAASFKSAIPKYIMGGTIEGIVIDAEKKPYRYYPESE